MKFQVDLTGLVFKLVENRLCILLTKRADDDASPWKLPSIPFSADQSPEELLSSSVSELGVKPAYIEQLYTFTEPKDGSLTVAYIVLASPDELDAAAVDKPAKWVSSKRVPKLWGPHEKIKDVGIQRLRNKISYSRIATRLLGEEFTLNDLKIVYEQILDEPVDKRNFRKKIESKKLVVPTDKFRHGIHRPARLYKRGPKSKNVPL